MQRRFLSVSELAQACSPTDADGELDKNKLNLWTRRLRHWSRLNVFPAESMRHARAGRHRLYSADLVYIASVLLRLSGCGLPAELIKLISEELQEETQREGFSEFWEQAKRYDDQQADKHYLLIWVIDEAAQVYLQGTMATLEMIRSLDEFDPATEPTLMLSLSDVFRRVRLA
jgi:DNA-binding transcriptional MerR regulator